MTKYTISTKKKGFTLIEIIVVIAIIGILMAILVPSFLGYVRKARKTSDMASAKEIHNCVNQIITENKKLPWTSGSYKDSNGNLITQYSNAMDSFYGHGSSYRGINNGWYSNYYLKADENGTVYKLYPVCRLSKWTNWVWQGVDREEDPFAEYLSEQMAASGRKTKIPVKYQPKGQSPELDTWIVCYRSNDVSQIEVWVGGKESGGQYVPLYRVYPDPTY